MSESLQGAGAEIILEGVYARYAAGQYGKVAPGIEAFARLVERLAEAADEAERKG